MTHSYPRVRCTMPTPTAVRDDDGDHTTYPLLPCHEEVRVTWMHSVDPAGIEEPIESQDAGGWAVVSMWRVECMAGHVLAVSAEEEDAEPFDGSMLADLPVEEVEIDLRTGRPVGEADL